MNKCDLKLGRGRQCLATLQRLHHLELLEVQNLGPHARTSGSEFPLTRSVCDSWAQ